jgi:pimeloyl-ACP methyl ester carboxylesterase
VSFAVKNSIGTYAAKGTAVLFLFGLAFLVSCMPDQQGPSESNGQPNPSESHEQPGSSDSYDYRSVDTTVLSRGVAVPVTFVVPVVAAGKSFPLIVMAHGHGASRNEGGGYRTVAEDLAMRGIGSIRMDFPGCGESIEPFTENHLSNMLLDLQASRKFAASQPGVDNERVGLLGFSMGGRLVALLSEIDPTYRVMATWAPAVANGSEREVHSLGGPDAYDALRQQAMEQGFAQFTTRWGMDMQLSQQWFTDLEQSKPLDAVRKFEGPLLVIYGDQDDVVPPRISEAAIEAAQNSSEVVRHVIPGAGHDLGFYSDRVEHAAEVVRTTVEFLSLRL